MCILFPLPVRHIRARHVKNRLSKTVEAWIRQRLTKSPHRRVDNHPQSNSNGQKYARKWDTCNFVCCVHRVSGEGGGGGGAFCHYAIYFMCVTPRILQHLPWWRTTGEKAHQTESRCHSEFKFVCLCTWHVHCCSSFLKGHGRNIMGGK